MAHNCDTISYKQITDEMVATQIVRSEVLQLIHQFYRGKGFMLVDPPVLHEQIAQKRHEIYLPYGDNRYSLNSSNALYMAAYASFYQKVYAISPSFRDEQDSINHLVEFRMLEVELLDMTYKELSQFVEEFILYLLIELSAIKIIKEHTPFIPRIQRLRQEFQPKRMPYNMFIQSVEHLSGYEVDSGVDLSTIDHVISQYIYEPIFIMDYPKTLATWTAKLQNNVTAFAFNLILPGGYGELCEGCERNNNLVVLNQKMKMAGIENLQWYLNSIENCSGTRCGFGIGIDRLVRWLVGAPHIKETLFFPRMKS